MSAEAAAASRAEVLRRIRVALGDSAGSDATEIRAEWEAIPRNYVRTSTLARESILELLEDRLRDYDATVVRANAGHISATIARRLTERGKRRLVVPAGLKETLGEPLPSGFELIVDEGFTPKELDAFDGVVSGATVAIGETGTIVLQDVRGQGRRAPTLVPDYHLCVVRATDVVETVPEAMARLAETAGLATTFISAPLGDCGYRNDAN